jgi:hypothetical protein
LRETDLRATAPDTPESATRGNGGLKAPIFLLHRLRGISYWAIRSGIAAKLAHPLVWLDRRRGLYVRGWLAGIADRHADHTEFWSEASRRYPSDASFVRRKVNAALRAGKIADAEVGLSALIASRKTIVADCGFVIGLTFADLRAGNIVRLRRRVRAFLAAFRGTAAYRVAAVRLSRVIFTHFSREAEKLDRVRWRRERFLHLLERSEVRSEPKKLLVRVAACEAQLERTFPGCLFDTDISSAECRAFVSLVRSRLALRQPFALVRAGDGEAACLPYEPRLAAHASADARERERIWWGKPLSPDLRARIAPAVADAIWEADCIGIPTSARFLRELRLDQEDTLEHSLTGRGLRSLLYCVERYAERRSPARTSPIFTSCHLHQELAIWDCYGELLDGVRDVVFISCHPGLADLAHARFGVHIAASLVLPPDRVSGPFVENGSSDGGNLPEILDSVLERLGDLPRNRLVLIGAGYPGKILVDIARQRGGIALDLGSIFDYWLGLRTRSYLDLDSGD